MSDQGMGDQGMGDQGMGDAGTPDPRPRPAYGEYATPEEQRARISRPGPAAVPAHVTAQSLPESVPVIEPAEASPVAPRWPADRVVTLILLAIGAFNVVSSVFSYLDLAAGIDGAMDVMGVPGEFTKFDAARTWGAIAAVVLVSGYLLTLVWSLNRMRAGRLSWWIPLLGAVVTFVIVSACVAVPLVGDPAFAEYVSSLS